MYIDFLLVLVGLEYQVCCPSLASEEVTLVGRCCDNVFWDVCNCLCPYSTTSFPCRRLELWPGFVTSILQYEKNIMLSLDISHKILRTDTVYDYMNEVYMSGKGVFHDEVAKGLVGEIVLTRWV